VAVLAFLVRTELRQRWRSMVLLGLLGALVVATVMTAAAGARRSRSAFDRYLTSIKPFDVTVQGDPGHIGDVLSGPYVEVATRTRLLALFPKGVDSSVFFPMFAPDNDAVGSRMLILPLVEGRRADPAAPLEVNLGERTAGRLHVRPGGKVPMYSFTDEQAPEVAARGSSSVAPAGPSVDLEVVGIVRDPGDLASRQTDIAVTFLTPAFTREYGDRIGTAGEISFVRLHHTGDIRAFASMVQANGDVGVDPSFTPREGRSQVDPTMAATAAGLWAFALLAGLAGAVAVAQVGARSAQRSSANRDVLAAIGVSAAVRRGAFAATILVSLVPASIVGATAAIAASALMPIGLARRAEPDPGPRIDVLVLAAGVAAALVVAALLSAIVATLADRRSARFEPSRSGIAAAVAAAGAPLVVTTGAQLALVRGRGARAIPARAAVLGVTVAMVGVLAAATFSASSSHLRSSPHLFGWSWDGEIVGHEQTGLQDAALGDISNRAVADDAFAAVATVWFELPMTLDGRPVHGMAIRELKGRSRPVITHGRPPGREGELVLGASTLREIGRDVGDEVEATLLGGPKARMRIVGVAALPVGGDGGSSSAGAVMTDAAASALGLSDCTDEASDCRHNVVVTYAPGAPRRGRAL
jgi:hypothetical protein